MLECLNARQEDTNNERQIERMRASKDRSCERRDTDIRPPVLNADAFVHVVVAFPGADQHQGFTSWIHAFLAPLLGWSIESKKP